MKGSLSTKLDPEGKKDPAGGLTRSSFKASFLSAIFFFLAALLFPPPPAVSSTLMGLLLNSVLWKYNAFYNVKENRYSMLGLGFVVLPPSKKRAE